MPGKRGSDREGELSAAPGEGSRSELGRAGELCMDGSQNHFCMQWAQREEVEPWPWPEIPACSCSLLVPLQSTLDFGLRAFHYKLEVVRGRRSTPGNSLGSISRAQGGGDAPGRVSLSSLQPQSPWLAFPFWLYKKWNSILLLTCRAVISLSHIRS